MNRRHAGLFLAFWFTALFTSGCFFTPREAQDPGGEQITYIEQSSPENVIANIETALSHRDPAGYERQIAEEFSYQPDSDTEASYPGVDWLGWDREQEFAFMSDFLGNVDGVAVDMKDVEIFTQWSGSEAELRYIYRAEVTEGGGEVPYRASVTLEFRLDGTFWVLTRWFDEQGEEDPGTGSPLPSLGQRRGAFAAAGGG
ncbi:nuclear transport factor 2 family protein [bacterium]|nr:nuclear transport factor 2 family protein [bacterium]